MRIRKEVEDSALQAGWIFADLFLALTIIFLATVSYIPSLAKPDPGNSKVSLNNNQKSNGVTTNINFKNSAQMVLISNGFIGEYRSNSVASFVKNFQEYLTLKEIGKDSKAIYVEAIGHTSNYGAPDDQGNLNALKFLIEIRKQLPVNFDGVSSSINLSPEVETNSVRIKVTFI